MIKAKMTCWTWTNVFYCRELLQGVMGPSDASPKDRHLCENVGIRFRIILEGAVLAEGRCLMFLTNVPTAITEYVRPLYHLRAATGESLPDARIEYLMPRTNNLGEVELKWTQPIFRSRRHAKA